MIKLLLAVGVLMIVLGAGHAAAGILTFDGLPQAASMNHSHYGGLNWSGFNALTLDSFHSNDAMGNEFAYSNLGPSFTGYPFTVSISADPGRVLDFIAGSFSANWENNLRVTVTAYLDGEVKYTTQLTLLDGMFQTMNLNYVGVDQVTFAMSAQGYPTYTPGYGGYGNPFYWQQQYAFSMDNIVFNERAQVPEPASILLLLAGVVSARLFPRTGRRNRAQHAQTNLN